MDFIIGCNYWASHAGTEMWTDWNEDVVRRDFDELSKYGVKYLRVFPNWRDFQPIEPIYAGSMTLREYRMRNGSMPSNPYYIDEEMIARFRIMCRLAEERGIKLIVGIVTGWMSGRLFIPTALNGLNLYTDPVAIMLTQKFVHGFVKMTKDEQAIVAWDLGNECNCMCPTPSRAAAYSWTSLISDAIKSVDNSRKIISGMHGLRIDNLWTIADQGELTDMLTTHPYPYWVEHTRVDRTLANRTLLHAAAETELYRAIGGKPVLVEEIGTMGPQVCSENAAGIFMRCQLWNAFAGGHEGLLWWCAFDQNELSEPPYEWTMVERYLGLFENGYVPKPALLEMKRMAALIPSLPFSPSVPVQDAVCILSKDIDHWGIAYTTYVLAKRAGLNISFAYANAQLPKSKLYLLPSINGTNVMDKSKYEALKDEVKAGATLYISCGDAIITEFEELTGVRILDSSAERLSTSVVIDDEKFDITLGAYRYLEPTVAEVLLRDTEGRPILMKNKFGNGTVYYSEYPVEADIIKRHRAFESDIHKLYSFFSSGVISGKPIYTKNPNVCVNLYDECDYAVLVNCSDKEQDSGLVCNNGYSFEPIYSSPDRIAAGDGCVIRLFRK